MSAGQFTFFDKALLKLGQGVFDFSSDTLKAALVEAAQALDATFTGTSTDCRYADLTDELGDSSYTMGGEALTSLTWTEAAGVVTLDCDDVLYPSLSGTYKYFVVYDDSAANKDLLGFVDLDETGGGSITNAGTDYYINVPGTGLADLQQVFST